MKQLGVGQPVHAPIVDRNDVADIHVAGTATAHETGSLVPHEDSLTLTGRYLGS